MNSLSTVTHDSAKILTDKLALSRELALLKPEVEHLRSQLNYQKDVLAEKLALERQLNTLEVELANEKRAAQKAANRPNRDSDAEEDLHKQIHDLEKQLAKEKRAAQKAIQNQDSKDTAAEEALEELREKLAEAEKMLLSEKKAASKAAKATNATTADSDEELKQLREELAEAKTVLTREKKEKEQLRKDHEKALAEAESRRLPLEERLDNMKAKLRETRAELKQCRADLEHAQERLVMRPAAKIPAGKKRRANEITIEETMLHTPTADDRLKRTAKRGFGLAGVGEKSTFSITPFLNKTVNLSDLSPKPQTESSSADATSTMPTEVDSEPTTVEAVEEEPAAEAAKAAPAAKKPRGRSAAKVLGDASPSKKNMPVPKKRKAQSAESTLEKVLEEAEDDNQGQENRSAEDATAKAAQPLKRKTKVPLAKATNLTEALLATAISTASRDGDGGGAAAVEQSELKKKKRKLLGGPSKMTTLFGGEADAEDAERAVPAPGQKRPAVTAAAAAKRPPVTRPVKRAVGLGTAKNAFAGAAFSPLKRDKRGVNASFLA